MAYCGVQDVRRALVAGGASSGTNTAADITNEALDDAVEEASSTVDSFIDGPYDPEVDFIPPVVKFWTRDIAAYLAMLTWRGAKAPAANNPVTLRYQHAMAMLQGVADGSITIMGPENADDQPAVINQYQGKLIGPRSFDLCGTAATDNGGFPLGVGPGYVWWYDE